MKKQVLSLYTLFIGISAFGQSDPGLITGQFSTGPGIFELHDPIFSEKGLNGSLQTYSLGVTSITSKRYTEVSFKVSRGVSNERTMRESFRNFDLKIREGFSLTKDNTRSMTAYAGYGIRTSPSIYDQVSVNQKKLAWYTVSELSYYQSFLWRFKRHSAYLGLAIPILAVASSPQGTVMQKDASDVSFLVSSIYHQSTLTSIPDMFGLDLGAKYAFSLDNKFTIGLDVDYSFSNIRQAQNTFRQQITNITMKLGYHFKKN